MNLQLELLDMKIDLYEQSGSKKGTLDVKDEMFKVEVNEELIRLALIRQQAGKRQNAAHTKTRADVRGGGKKPWRQKGTGRARFGSSRNPIWRSGGVAHGPRAVRNFSKDMPKKARRQALFSCLSQKAADSQILALTGFKADKPKTKDFVAFMGKLPEHRSVLIVMDQKNEVLEKSVSNVPNAKTILVNYLNPHDLLKYDKVVFLEPAIKKAEELFL